jgi:hypothetical protein
MRMSRRVGVVTLAVVCAAAVVGGCSTSSYEDLPVPEGFDDRVTSSTVQLGALDEVPLAPVRGATTSVPVALGPGPIRQLAGRVDGPDGPVAGAIVHVERLGARGIASVNVPTAADGTWNVANVLGGRYRVRAWLAPSLGMTRAATLFVSAPRPAPVVLRLARFDGLRIDAVIAPNPPVVGAPANLRVRVLRRAVTGQGYIESTPVASTTVTLAGSGSWGVSGSNPDVTGADGTVTFEVVCGAAGAQPLSAILDDGTEQALALPACQ